jgi:N-acetylmuramoyl-L-alanine amidase
LMTSPKWQAKISKALTEAVDSYFASDVAQRAP